MGSGRLETCWSCRRPVFLAERLVAGGKLRHRTCFTCKRCGNQLNLVGCYETESGDFVCETCPDEEKENDISRSENETLKTFGNEQSSSVADEPVKNVADDDDDDDDYSLNFEIALDSFVKNRNSSMKEFLGNLINSSSSDSPDTKSPVVVDSKSNENPPSVGVLNPAGTSLEYGSNLVNSVPPVKSADVNQHSTASLEKTLNTKIKTLLGRDFKETLSLLNHEPESFLADVSDIIDSVISDAVKKVEEKLEDDLSEKPSDEKELLLEKGVGEEKDVLIDNNVDDDDDVKNPFDSNGSTAREEEKKKKESLEATEINESLVSTKDESMSIDDAHEKAENYPEDLNPFADFEEDEKNVSVKTSSPSPRKPPVPAVRTKTPRKTSYNQSGKKIIEAPKVNLNPFWSDGEQSSDDETGGKPIPAPRTLLKVPEEDSPFSRSQYGSFSSLNSLGSTASYIRKKKGPAPQPPAGTKSLQYPVSPPESLSSQRSSSPTASIRSHRKSKPAPPPPPIKYIDGDYMSDKKEKNYENKMKQNLSVPDKSSYGKWKRKKGQAPALPIPQRRRITPLPLPEFYRELEDLEIQQRELERQGVTIEQTIRMYETDDSTQESEGSEMSGKDVEGMILQLFDIVNQKNELFRRQAELMYL